MLRNLCLYRIPADALPERDAIEAALTEHAFAPCGLTEPQRVGWVPALHDQTAAYVHGGNGLFLLRLREQNRLLPAGVVNEQLAELVQKREIEEGRKLGKKEKSRLRDELVFTLLPRAFTKTNDMRAILAPEAGFILIDSGSLQRAEMLLNALRLALGSLPVQRLAFSAPLPTWMTAWLTGKATMPEPFTLGVECEIADEEGSAKIKGMDLVSAEVRNHLEAGREVNKLALEFQDALSFILQNDGRLSRLKMSDRLRGELDAEHPEDEMQARDAEFTMMGLTLLRLLPPLLEGLGETKNT